jgi:tetratricopeptide (TPR) repeat protein
MALATIFVLTVAGIDGAVGFSGNLPSLLFAFAFPIAWLDATSTSPAWTLRPGILRVGLIGLAAILGLVYSAWIRAEAASVDGDAAVAALADRQYQDALELAEKAIQRDNDLPLYWVIAGLSEAAVGDKDAAERHFLAAATTDDLAESWLNAAALKVDREDFAGAAQDLVRAERLGLQRPQVAVPAAILWLELNQPARSVHALTSALTASPSLADDPFLSQGPLAPILDAAINRGVTDGPSRSSFEMELRTGRPVTTSGLDDQAAATADLIVAAWDGDVAARQELEQYASTHPMDLWAVGWCAKIAKRVNDDEAVDRYRRWANIVDPLSASQLTGVVRVDDKRGPRAGINWTVSSAYGTALYRRPNPANLVLPELPGLRME